MSYPDNPKEIYKASLDTVAKIMTVFVFLMGVAGIILIFTVPPWYGGLFLFATGFVLILVFYIYSVKSYRITDEKLIIERPFSHFNKEFPLSNISSARLEVKGEFRWTIRSAGNGGIFGYSGTYVNNQIGNFIMYATNRNNRVIIILKHPVKTIVISPDDSDLVEAINNKLHKYAPNT